MINRSDREFYQVQIDSALRKLEQAYGTTFRSPSVEWSLRGRSRLGAASGDGRTIKLNASYAAALGRDAYLQTVLHEACHIATTQRRFGLHGFGRPSSGPWASHGAEWKRAMRLLGLKPDRCASVPTEVAAKVAPGRRVTRHEVYCACPNPHLVTTQMLAKVNRGVSLRCNTCKVVVTPVRGTIVNREAVRQQVRAYRPKPTTPRYSTCCFVPITSAGFCSHCSEPS